MRKTALLIALISLPSAAAHANEMDDAMKKLGPAFMCGPPHEFREALSSLRQAMQKAGVPETLIDYGVDGLSKFIVKEHSATRDKITAKDCADRYGR